MVLCLAACGEEEAEVDDEPEAVEPVEIVGEDEAADGTQTATVDGEETDVAALQARVAELERQLAECRGEDAPAAGGTQTAAVPEGVDVPSNAADADDDDDSTETASASSARSARGRRGRREPGLLGTLLGEGDDTEGSGRRGRRGSSSGSDDDGEPVVLDPTRVLLGE